MLGIGRSTGIPPVIKALMIINVVIYALDYLVLNNVMVSGVPLHEWIISYGALWPVDVKGTMLANLGANVFWPHQLITYMFLHGGFWHVFMNMFMLWMIGSEMERVWGSAKFLCIYIFSGIGAALLHLGVLYILGENNPTIGASGAVMGIMAAFAATFPKRKLLIFPLFIPISAWLFVIILMGIELFSGFTLSDSVAHFAHIGGAITGFLLTKYAANLKFYSFIERMFKFKLRANQNQAYTNYNDDYNASMRNNPNQYYQKPTQTPTQSNWHATVSKEPPAPNQTTSARKSYTIGGESITQERIDAILDKISAQGYQNLDDKEKNILNELSKKL
jgi:membrane associated rhomboid family serine protease